MKYKERRLCSFGKFMFRLRRRDVDQFKGWKKKKLQLLLKSDSLT